LVSYSNLIFGICDADCKTNNLYTSKRIEINLFSNEDNKNFQREGQSLKKILKEGVEFFVDINLKNNIFKIYDSGRNILFLCKADLKGF